MASKIVTRFKILVAEKEMREGKRLTYRVIGKATGISPTTLTEYANNNIKRFDSSVVTRLCEYFDCALSDLLVISPNGGY